MSPVQYATVLATHLAQHKWDAMLVDSLIAALGWMIILVVVAFVLCALFLALRPPQKQTLSSPTQSATPLDTLKLRYARREITREEFWQIKKDLEA